MTRIVTRIVRTAAALGLAGALATGTTLAASAADSDALGGTTHSVEPADSGSEPTQKPGHATVELAGYAIGGKTGPSRVVLAGYAIGG